MQTELLKEIRQVLQSFPQYWNGETLRRFDVVTAIENKEPNLIKAIISNQKLKLAYSTDIDGVLLFDFAKLVGLIQYKEYWNDSYTKYKNKIGLTIGGNYLDYNTDVVLTFPFKDCVLEGGMSKAEVANKDDFTEVYYNEVVASDEIDRLFSPKVLTKAVRYSRGGIENVVEFSDKDNLIIKGNNLLALHSLKERFLGKIKLIYIDPPFNTGSDDFPYNDKFNRSTWLTFMKSRIEVAKELLTDDGVIFVHCDYNEDSYLRVLLDEVLTEDNFVSNIAVRSSTPSGTKTAHKDKKIIKQKDTILVYKKNNIKIKPQYSARETWDTHYSVFLYKEDGKYKSEKLIDVLKNNGFSYNTLDEIDPKNEKIRKFILENKNNVGRWQSHKNKELEILSRNQYSNEIYEHQNNGETVGLYYNGQVFTPISQGLKEVIVGNKLQEYWSILVCDFWGDIDFQNTQNEGDVSFPKGKKPEALLHRIIDMTTTEGDIVLDYHLGSGTTAAVAHKMGRQYIGIEQMDYIETLAVERLKNVIERDETGISKAVNWQGGGSFVYFELAKLNQNYLEKISQADNTDQLLDILKTMKAEAYLNYQIQLDKILKQTYEKDGVNHEITFIQLSLSEQKEILIGLLDKNQLYINLSEMDDQNMQVSNSDKQFTQSFYQINRQQGE